MIVRQADSSRSGGLGHAGVVYVVVFAKPASPGRCKTRLIGKLSANDAAKVHAGMTQCLIDRLSNVFGGESTGEVVGAFPGKSPVRLVLAIDWAGERGCEPADWGRANAEMDVTQPAFQSCNWGFKCRENWGLQLQGTGSLGDRIARVWSDLGEDRRVVLLGSDAPDLPVEYLRLAVELARKAGVHDGAQVGLGPASDGGYWTLAAGRLWPCLFDRIDWGGPNVYHQTMAAGDRHGLVMRDLPLWDDVDQPADLFRLMKRLAGSTDLHLQKLEQQLASILKDYP